MIESTSGLKARMDDFQFEVIGTQESNSTPSKVSVQPQINPEETKVYEKPQPL